MAYEKYETAPPPIQWVSLVMPQVMKKISEKPYIISGIQFENAHMACGVFGFAPSIVYRTMVEHDFTCVEAIAHKLKRNNKINKDLAAKTQTAFIAYRKSLYFVEAVDYADSTRPLPSAKYRLSRRLHGIHEYIIPLHHQPKPAKEIEAAHKYVAEYFEQKNTESIACSVAESAKDHPSIQKTLRTVNLLSDKHAELDSSITAMFRITEDIYVSLRSLEAINKKQAEKIAEQDEKLAEIEKRLLDIETALGIVSQQTT